ncbi:MAG: CoA transferase [Hyphomicrobiaceae bacterium]|nr:CoA transferase [Hyphomicrobiaceae bacterium]
MAADTAERRNLPLDGITVIDLGQIYQGPYATLLMAKAGAKVIKVEPPHGEPARWRSKVGRGATLPMVMLNSNKRGIVLNLKTEKGRELLAGLASKADVLLENFAPGVMEKLGIGWSRLSELNPRLVYASGTGYGLTGPERDSLAMDVTVQAASGFMSVTGFPDRPPVKAGPAVIDFLSGVHLYGAIVTALYERTITGRGRLVEVAMQEAAYASLASSLGMIYESKGDVPLRVGNRHSGLSVAPYNVYKAKDGWVAIICAVEGHWLAILEAMGRMDLAEDPRFSSNPARVAHIDETDALVESWTSTLTRAEFKALAKRHRIPSSPVRDVKEVMLDPHMHERGMLEWIDHPDLGRIVVPTSPLRFHGAETVATTPSPQLGQHTAEVLEEMLGIGPDAFAQLKEEGAV